MWCHFTKHGPLQAIQTDGNLALNIKPAHTAHASTQFYTCLCFLFLLFHGFAPGIFTGNDFQQRRNGIVAYLGDTQLATQVHDNGTITVTAGYTDDNRVTTDVQKASVLVTYLC